MKKIALLIIILSNSIFSQNSKVDSLILFGNQKFEAKQFIDAKEIFEKALKIDSLNKDILYNLAATELNLNNIKKACRLLQKGYKLNDWGTRELIIKYCGEIEYSETMYFEDVDSQPMFVYKNKELPIRIKSKAHPKLISLFIKESRKSPIIKKYRRQKVFLLFYIDKNGKFVSKATKTSPRELNEEVELIFNRITNYIPSKYKGKNVETRGGYTLLLYFE